MRLLSPSLPGSDAAAGARAKPKWNSEFDDVPVPVIAEWQGLKMSAGDITRLKTGDVLTLDPACAAQVQIQSEPGAKIHRPPRHFRRQMGRATDRHRHQPE